MSQRIVSIMGVSCLLALGLSIWMVTAGFGVIAALATYSLTGSSLVLLLASAACAFEDTDPALTVALDRADS